MREGKLRARLDREIADWLADCEQYQAVEEMNRGELEPVLEQLRGTAHSAMRRNRVQHLINTLNIQIH